jgi:hypothetical protein
MKKRARLFLLPLLLPTAPLWALEAKQTAFFEEKVRPILSEHCYKCHSHANGKARGELTLDTRDGMLKGGESGKVIVPGKPEQSSLIRAVSYTDSDLQMPPPKDGGKLSGEQIRILTEWVKMGAPDPRTGKVETADATGKLAPSDPWKHWTFQPVVKPPEPSVADRSWVRHPIDAFVLQKLEQNGLKPNPPAARETWLRRVTYDLTGLPPSPADLESFLRDTSPRAKEKVVDRLLASPQYGERWGRHWLDTARYADTKGDEQVARREQYRFPYAWTYRDYVIQSFNEDKPYDQFLLEQIAVDRLPGVKPDDPRQAALGFLTVGQRFPMPNDTINERIDTVTKATLGLTVACARCHDHYFDPVPTADYYSLHGIFASVVEPDYLPRIADGGAQQAEFERELADLERRNRDIFYSYVQEYNSAFRTFTKEFFLASLYNRSRNTFAGRTATNEDILRVRKAIQRTKVDEEVARIVTELMVGGRSRFHSSLFAPWKALAQEPEAGWAEKAAKVLATLGEDRRQPVHPKVVEVLKGKKPADREELAALYARVFAGLEQEQKAWIEQASRTKAKELKHANESVRELLDFPLRVQSAGALDTVQLQQTVARWPQNLIRRTRFLFTEINTLQLTHPGSPAHAMVVRDAERPRDSNILLRGEAQSRGAVVPRRFLQIIAGEDRPAWKEGSGRLELARAIVDPANPLTARAAVNRIWMHHFGEGIIPTPEDIGVMSEAPSHRELLDWLAATFVAEGWSFKKLHRQILLTSTYAQSSDTRADGEAKDPQNRLLWRAHLRRLDFEAIRDSMLVFSGDLDPTPGGKPVNLTDEPYSFRRSVYGFIDRGNLPELMTQFDFSDPDMPNSKRTTTVVPQQALFMMNSPMAIDVSRRIVQRPEFTAHTGDDARIRALFQILFQRAPREVELALARNFLENARQEVEPAAAKPVDPKLAARARDEARREERRQVAMMENQMRRQAGRTIRNEGERVERKPLTPWELLAQSLLFTNEMVYVN